MKQTMLDRAINGREVVAYASGLCAPRNKNSNLYQAIVASGHTVDDLGVSISIAIGAHRRRGTEGWKMAIVKKEKKGEN